MRYVAKNPNERMSRQAIETLNEVKDEVKHGDMIHAFNRLHITDGICPTLTTRPEGFKTASLVVEDINEKESDNLSEVVRYDLSMPVEVRKHVVNTIELRALLRGAKANSGLTNKEISEIVERPMTEVEHWFRTDDCFSIPSADV